MDRLPAWIVDGSPAWVVECVDTFPPHVRSRLSPSAPTPAATGLLKALADMARSGAVSFTVAPQVLRWAGWTWRPQDGWEPA